MTTEIYPPRSIESFPVRLKTRLRAMPLYYRVRNALMKWRYAGIEHDTIYDDSYFAGVERATSKGAELMVDCIMSRFSPRSALDVGCGTGALLDAMQKRGVKTLGIDYSDHALEYCRNRGVACQKMNLAELSDKNPIEDRFDIAINMEVAHQLPEKAAVRLVKLLAEVAPIVVFSAETPGTFDRLPLNEQQPKYWVDLFRQVGLSWDQETTKLWRERWKTKDVADYFCKNVMVFVAKGQH